MAKQQTQFNTLFSQDFHSTKYCTFAVRMNTATNGERISKFVNIGKVTRSWKSGEMQTSWNNVCIPHNAWKSFLAAVATVDKLIGEPTLAEGN